METSIDTKLILNNLTEPMESEKIEIKKSFENAIIDLNKYKEKMEKSNGNLQLKIKFPKLKKNLILTTEYIKISGNLSCNTRIQELF